MALFPGLPRWVGTRKVKPIWILLKQETVSGSGISWAICKSAPYSRVQTDNHTSTPPLCFYKPDALPVAEPTASKHWRQDYSQNGQKCWILQQTDHILVRKQMYTIYKKYRKCAQLPASTAFCNCIEFSLHLVVSYTLSHYDWLTELWFNFPFHEKVIFRHFPSHFGFYLINKSYYNKTRHVSAKQKMLSYKTTISSLEKEQTHCYKPAAHTRCTNICNIQFDEL